MYGRGNHSTNHSPDDPGGRINVAADMLDIEAPAAHSTPTSPAHKVWSKSLIYGCSSKAGTSTGYVPRPPPRDTDTYDIRQTFKS